jgi:type VI secretion system secreted protein VgrG
MSLLNLSQLSASEAELVLKVDECSAALHVRGFQLSEAVGSCFDGWITVATDDGSLRLGSLIGHGATLAVHHAGGVRFFHGIIRTVRTGRLERHWYTYELRVAPRMWLLSLRSDCRIFQQNTTPQILHEVLKGGGVPADDIDDRLRGTYGERDYCVQYRESDLDFVSRLMEEEGISWFFTHEDGRHVLVLTDDPHSFDELSVPLVLRPARDNRGAQSLHEVSLTRSLGIGKLITRDYAFKDASGDMSAEAVYQLAGAEDGDVADPSDVDLFVYDWPGEYTDVDLGQRITNTRQLQAQIPRFTLHGASDVRECGAGLYADVEDHPRSTLNRRYLLVRVQHTGAQPLPDVQEAVEGYGNRIEAVPDGVPFVPPRTTPRPVIAGLHSAKVTGPAGEEIHCDEFGRVKVKFHWDRSDVTDDSTSCWVRVSQGGAGAGQGSLMLPRVGQEVIVQFLEGDPDRPLVTGRVYNSDQTLPYPLPDNRTRSVIKSHSSPGGAGSNELYFEDKAGEEEVFIHAQRDLTIKVERNASQSFGKDTSSSTVGNATGTVQGDASHTVNGGSTIKVDGDQSNTTGGSYTVSVTGDHNTTVDGASSTTVNGGDLSLTASAGNLNGSASADVALTAGANLMANGDATAKVTSPAITIDGASTLDMNGGSTLTATSPAITIDGASTVVISGGSSVTVCVGGSSITIDSGSITINTPTLNLNGTGTINLNGGLVNATASGPMAIKGAVVSLN